MDSTRSKEQQPPVLSISRRSRVAKRIAPNKPKRCREKSGNTKQVSIQTARQNTHERPTHKENSRPIGGGTLKTCSKHKDSTKSTRFLYLSTANSVLPQKRSVSTMIREPKLNQKHQRYQQRAATD